MVREARRSTALTGHPVTESCTSCYTEDQYMLLRLERHMAVGTDNDDGLSDTDRLTL